jgi:hypothetical protein
MINVHKELGHISYTYRNYTVRWIRTVRFILVFIFKVNVDWLGATRRGTSLIL